MIPWAGRLAAAAAVVLLVGGAAAISEKVELQLPVGSTPAKPQYGVLLFGHSEATFPSAGTSIDIGNPDPQLTSAVAFGKGFRPALGARAAGSGATLALGPPLEIPLKVWVLCVNANCDGSFGQQIKDKFETFLFKSNLLLDRERTGLVLTKAGTEWISDQTGNAAKREEFKNFSTEGDTDDCGRLGKLTSQMKKSGALNMYAVGRVDGDAWRGESCLERDITVVAAAASWHTRLHEIGHNLGLLHVDEQQITKYDATKNLMHKASSDRRYLSEGQTFLIYFDQQTALHDVFSSLLPAGWDFRDCTDAGKCPPLATWIWDDQD